MRQEETFEEPWRDEIIEEIRKIREEHAARFNNDVRAMVEDLRKRQQEGGRKVVSFPPRRPQVLNKPAG